MELFTPQEIQAIVALLNRTPMSLAEQLFAQGFFQRLAQFCQPPSPEPEPGPESDPPAPENTPQVVEPLDESESG